MILDLFKLDGKVAVVTGANTGLVLKAFPISLTGNGSSFSSGRS